MSQPTQPSDSRRVYTDALRESWIWLVVSTPMRSEGGANPCLLPQGFIRQCLRDT